MKPIYEQFIETATKFSDRPALRYKKNGHYKTILFSELQQQVGACASGLYGLGVSKGDRVAIL